MAKFLDKCPNCGDMFTNYNEQPTKYCSVLCQLASPIIEDSGEIGRSGDVRMSKSVKVCLTEERQHDL